MTASEIEKLKELIEREKKASINKKTPCYSLNTKREIVKLAKTMSPGLIVTELGISRSFVGDLVRKDKQKGLSTKKQDPSPIQFLQLNDQINRFVKEDAPKPPTVRLSTESGITIEIFS